MNIRENDLLICKPREGSIDKNSKPFNVYARIISVDIKNNKVKLDAYQEEGRFRCKPRILKPDSIKEYYVPMNQTEINELYQGLREFTNSQRFKWLATEEKDTVYDTFKAVKEQAKLKSKTFER